MTVSDPADRLGGRLPLADLASSTEAQRELFNRMMTTVVPWADKNGFQATTADGRLIGPLNPGLLNPAIGAQFLELQFTEQQHTSLCRRVREVVILTVGAIWHADYELYSHSATARQAGLPDTAIARLINGDMPDDLTEQEKIAHRLTHQLSTSHHVSDGLYRDAEKAFGAAGVAEITVLAGIYQTVCGLLNVFAVPAPHQTDPQPSAATSHDI
jgi:4-carboxymuconolactone decarboxylase